ncbi:MAG TPA: hotdog domain-containing protein [Acidimicrobiales bacterium]|jgi:acyl-coenzyme A thioesterase PaaI-like protein|nr:hotdog domain-containing protein [Acidimicrobiales bacterium]
MTSTVEGEEVAPARRHVLQELGWDVGPSEEADGRMFGSAVVVPQMHAPGTDHLRISILAAWADVVAGYLAVETVGPRVPVTLELDVHLYRPAPGAGLVRGEGTVMKSGRSVFVAGVDFLDENGEQFGFAAASFMASPDERLRIDSLAGRAPQPSGPRLAMPFAERAGCVRRAPGVAALAYSDEVLNASNTINGGLIALTAEEAVLSLSPPGASLASLDLRYLQAARVGPAVATAEVRHGLGRVEVCDEGNENRLCVAATARTFEP